MVIPKIEIPIGVVEPLECPVGAAILRTIIFCVIGDYSGQVVFLVQGRVIGQADTGQIGILTVTIENVLCQQVTIPISTV